MGRMGDAQVRGGGGVDGVAGRGCVTVVMAGQHVGQAGTYVGGFGGLPVGAVDRLGYMPGVWPQGHGTGDDRGVRGFAPVAEHTDGAWRWPGRINAGGERVVGAHWVWGWDVGVPWGRSVQVHVGVGPESMGGRRRWHVDGGGGGGT